MSAEERLVLVVVLIIVMSVVLFYELRVMRRKSKEVQVVAQKKDEAYNAILTTRSVMNALSNQGNDTGNAPLLVERAKTAMNNGNFDRCIDLCAQARRELSKPSSKASDVAEPAGEDAADQLEEVAENILSEGMPPADADTYKGARLNRGAEGNYLGAKFEMTAAKADLSRAAKAGAEVSEAEILMTQADSSFTAGNYDKALSFAVRARRSLNPDKSREAIPLRSASAKQEPVPEPEVYDVEDEKTASGFPCPECGKLLDPTDIFCGSCGARLSKERHCGNCGAKARPEDTFCRKCGERIE